LRRGWLPQVAPDAEDVFERKVHSGRIEPYGPGMQDIGRNPAPVVLGVVHDGALLRKEDQVVPDAREREIVDELGVGVPSFAGGGDDLDRDKRVLDDY
jgi:hypothetical protein